MPTLAEIMESEESLQKAAEDFAEFHQERERAECAKGRFDGEEFSKEFDRTLSGMLDGIGERIAAHTPEEWRRFCAIGIDD